MLAEPAVGEALGEQPEHQQGGEQRLHARVAEAQRAGAAVVDDGGPVQILERLEPELAVVADALDAEQASVGREADRFQIIKVAQPSAHPEVVGVVDHRLGAQGAPALVVLLDVRVLVVHEQRRHHPVGDHAGPVPRRGPSRDASVEDQLHAVGPPQVEVLADRLLEEHAPLHGPVEDLGERELGLQDGDLVADPGRPVVARERVRQALEPLAQQVVDPLRRQFAGQPLSQRRVGTRQDAVVQRLEGDAALLQLSLDVLVAVHAQPRGVREVRAELHEHRPEVVVDQVEVVVVDHRRGVHQLHVVAAARLVLATLRAHHARLLLRLADEQHALAAGPAPQMFPHALLLALAAAELHQLDAGTLGEAFDGRHEVPRHRRHQRRRRHRVAAHLAEEPRRAAARLQHRHVGVQVHPVDALQLQRRVLVENLRRASCYRHGSDSGRWATHGPDYGHRRLGATINRGHVPQRSSGRGPFTNRPRAPTPRRSEAEPRWIP